MKGVLRRLVKTTLAALLLCAGIWIYFHVYHGCVVRNLTGIPCPTCGMTRAVLALASLHFKAAFYNHPLVYLLAPLTGVIAVLYIGFDIKPTDNRYTPVYIITIMIFFAVWIVRFFFFTIP
ncbi:MAG: DUF2752 domain-containing protein [Acetanaerobacterium sp.]